MQQRVLRLFDRLQGALYLLPLFLLLWYALTDGRGWAFGMLAVAVAAATAAALSPGAQGRRRVSPAGLLQFGAHFLRRSLEGGIDVAWRALHPAMPLVPREEWRPLDLPAGPGRTLFVAVVSLLPGTLVCEDAGGRVLIHSISTAPQEKLDALEARVVRAFGSAEAPPP